MTIYMEFSLMGAGRLHSPAPLIRPPRFLQSVSSFCRIAPGVRFFGDLCLQRENEEVVGQFLVKRRDQKELRPCLGIIHLLRLRSKILRLSPIILYFLRRFGIHNSIQRLLIVG